MSSPRQDSVVNTVTMFLASDQDKKTLSNMTNFVLALLSLMEQIEPASVALGMHMWQQILKIIIKSTQAMLDDLRELRNVLDKKEISMIPVASSTHMMNAGMIPGDISGDSAHDGDDEDSKAGNSKAIKPGARK